MLKEKDNFENGKIVMNYKNLTEFQFKPKVGKFEMWSE